MAGVSRLLEILRDENNGPKLSFDRLRSDAAGPGLRSLLSVLRLAIGSAGDGRSGFELWTRQQIEATLSVAKLIISSSVTAQAEQAEPVVLAIIESSLELCTCLLERSKFEGDDLSFQNSVVEALEAALMEGKDFEPDKHLPRSLEESLPAIHLDIVDMSDYAKCNIQGVDCLSNESPVDRVLMALASECLQAGYSTAVSIQHPLPKSMNGIISFSQHCAVIHVKCLPRLLTVAKEWLIPPISSKDVTEDISYSSRLSLSLRVIRLLVSVTKDIPVVTFDVDLMHMVACFVDALPSLFKLEHELESEPSTIHNSFGGLVLNLLEEFLQFVRIAFCDGIIFQNVRTVIIASMLKALDSNLCLSNRASCHLKAPVIYCPQVVMHLLKLIQDVKNESSQMLTWKEKFDMDFPHNLSSSESCTVVCHEDVQLLRYHTCEEHLRIILPLSRQWVDELVHLVYFLHSEGVKSMKKVDKLRPICVKPVSDKDSVTSHEEEAIFGDLFTEASRPAGSADGHDQQPIAASGSSNGQNMHISAVMELLTFLKLCVFSPDWHHAIYDDACRKLREHHIDSLLSILLCQFCVDDRTSQINCALSVERSSGHVNEICFDLLHNLLVRHALPSFLEEHLVDEILMVNNGKYTYNDYTLTLLAHALISKAGLSESHLASKIYGSYVNFMLERTHDIYSDCPDLNEFLGTLPCIFHIEILLMAFHLANEGEKTALAMSVSLAFREICAFPEKFNSKQLSCWGLLVSRLILVLRHMVLHPSTCPSWLLLKLRSKLRETSSGACFSHDHNNSASWVASAVVNIFGDNINELPVVNGLLPHLIDVGTVSSIFCGNFDGFQRLGVNPIDLFATFSLVIGFWNGKKAEAVEDLLLERYIFMLCWDTAVCIGSYCMPLKLQSPEQTYVASKIESFLYFSYLVLNQSNASDGADLLVNLMNVLHQLHSRAQQFNTAEVGWEFVRNGAWLSLSLSVLHSGIWMYSVKHVVSGIDPLWIGHNVKDSKFLDAAEDMFISIVETSKVRWLLTFLSSCLKMQLQILQGAFLSIFDQKRCFTKNFSYLLLLKHVLLDQGRSELLGKCGSITSQLESIFCLLSKLDEAAAKESMEIATCVVHRCLLHGFPSHTSDFNGLLLSSILTVRDIVCTIDGLLKITCASDDAHLEAGEIHEILESITIVKSDMVFQSIHGKCESIYASLMPSLRGNLDYIYLFELKHILGLLSEMNCQDTVDEGTREALIVAALDKVDGLRRDHSKEEVFKCLLGIGENACEEVKEYCGGQCVNLLVFIDSLEKCCSEAVNIRVLNFFVDLLNNGGYPGLMEKLQKKFIEIDLSSLASWLEKRLLGSLGSPGTVISKESSAILREATTNLFTCLISQPCEMISKNLQNRFVEAMLMCLDNAFMHYDISTAKAFFGFLVQLLSEESSIRQFLERIVMLMEKLAERDELLQGLKFLFGFLGVILGDYGANKSLSDKVSGRLSAFSGFAIEPSVSRQINRKNPEALVLSHNQETDSANVDCDASSGDEEDDDDGTSDGDQASVDKDDEDDSNSERVLASQVCTFTSSGNTFMEQHWYFCYTCDLTVSKGCCSICAKVCHRGHRVVYSRSSRFFCDCGAGGVRGSNCQCLKPRKFTSASNSTVHRNTSFRSLLPFSEDGDQTPDSDSDSDDDAQPETDSSYKIFIPKGMQDVLPNLLEDIDTEKHVLGLCRKLLPAVVSRRNSNISKELKVLLGDQKTLSYNSDIFHLRKTFKSGSFDLKIKAEYTNSRDLKAHLTSGSLVKSLFSISTQGRLAVGEGDKVSIFDASQLVGTPTVALITGDKTNVKPLSRNLVRFEIVHLVFNPTLECYLAVAGYEECQVLTVNPRGEVTDRLAIELALQGAYVRRVDWAPGSQVHLLVVTNMFVKIYDLSHDSISPIHYFTLADDMIVDATLITASMGRVCLLVLSELGFLYRLELSMKGDVGAKPLNERIQVLDRCEQPKGLSLYFSSVLRLLFLSYQDGTTLVGRLDVGATSLSEVSAIYETEQDGKARPAGLHHWKEILVDSGVFVCFSSLKANTILTVSFGSHELVAQSMRCTSGSAVPLVGITAYRPLSKDKSYCLALQEDGSLQIYSHAPVGTDATTNFNLDKAKKLGASILNNKGHVGMNTDFPLDFFEKTICITSEVKLSSDAIRNSDSEGTKQKLQSEDGFLESPSSSGFKIHVSNQNPDVVMVGVRIQVGNTSIGHIPSDVTIFQRLIKLDEGLRSWYDIPFTIAESLLADEEFTISIGPTFDGSTLPRIDSLEIYGRSKDEFGWKEKMEAVLNMEAHVLSSNYDSFGVRKKSQTMQAATIHEQVLADALKLLSKFYLSFKSRTCVEIEEAHEDLDKLKCKELLETIFQSDREPLLQSSASCVLKALFPKREIYYHVKDTLRLLGVISSLPILSSRIGAGGAASGWVIKEFMTQLRAVSRIALHRRPNMVSFLETHGSTVVDGLMEVLWGILDLERPNTQAINSIVIPSVELIYSYAECLALQDCASSSCSVAAAVILLKKLLFAPYEAVQTASSLAISSRLLQVPFPKQAILAADDVADNAGVGNMPSDMISGTGGNSHVMIEEDSNTSSVQYCCDGCSTVPILRRRWHCNVCPDFDLCETCYEVMDGDQLPPPHSKDHPMSAIPIEIDSIGGEGRGIQFTLDELNDANLMQVAADINMQNSPSSIHILESNESGDFTTSVNQRSVSISASKRAVNSLLLQELIVELKGWMETTSGVRAIPVMQLFYRLFSVVSASFMDSSKPENLDLEKIVKWFLDEINLNHPFSAKIRTSFGEVTILVFMFFTLMLRNWHQPGSESSQLKSVAVAETQDKGSSHIQLSSSIGSSNDDQEKTEFASQLTRACSFLRQQSFVNYLMDILQQLVQLFKSSHVDVESSHGLAPGSGCGSLLAVKKELPAGNFSPFFSDSYAKAHTSDLFVDYQRLLLENTFRLVYSLIRPEKHEKGLVKEKTYRYSSSKELKLDGFQDVLCSYICNPHTTFVRRYARKLLLHVCGSKTQYYNVRDSWQFSNEVRKLYKLVNKSGGFQVPVPYETSVKLVKCLSTMSEVAGSRPRNWQKYCIKHGDVLSLLVEGIFHFSEESVIQTLKLLSLAFYTGKDINSSMLKSENGDGVNSNKPGSQSDSKKKRKVEDGNEAGSEKSYLDMEQVVGIFCVKDGVILKHFIDSFLLEWNSASLRAEAKSVLYGIWHHGKRSFKEILLTALLQKVKNLPMYGQNIVEYTELLTSLLGKVPDTNGKQNEMELINQSLTPDVVNCIFETLHSQNELLANHPNSHIYSTLSCLVEFDGYYLESEPCVTCSCPEVPYNRMKLESLKSETKFTDNRIIVKCTGSYTIQTVTMNVHDARKSRSVKVLNLYYNNTPVADLSELKNNWSLWKRAKSCHLAFNQTELKVEFPIPITACNFMIELDSFYESLQASSLESLQCPRCSRSVTDKHGICSNCHENAYQCRQCRNINYENLDSFLCNECGFSKYGRFEFNFMAKPSFAFDNIENDEDMKKVLVAIELESENAHRRYQQLLGFKKPLLKLVSSIGEHEIDSQQKDTVQQMMVSLPGPSCKINRKIALLGVLYGEKCKGAFDSVSKSVQTLQGLRRVLMTYLNQKSSDKIVSYSQLTVSRSPNNCYGCAATFVSQCMELLQFLSKNSSCRKLLVSLGILSELFENNIHQGPKTARTQARAVLCAFSEGDANAVAELNNLIQKKVLYCLEHHRSMDIAQATCEELLLLSETCALVDEFWEARLRVAFKLLFSSIKLGAKHPAISEHVILPCLRIISQACTPPKTENLEKDQEAGKSASNLQLKNDQFNSAASLSKMPSDVSEKNWDGRKGQDIPLLSYSEWERGASYIDFVRRQYRISQAVKNFKRSRQEPQRRDFMALKYALRWKHIACRRLGKSDISAFELGSWISVLILSPCSQSIRLEVCTLITLLCPQNSSRQFQLLNLLITLLPASLSVGDSAADYFELFFKMIESEAARLFLTAKGCLTTICRLISQEVGNVEFQERSLNIDISQGFILHKLVELLSKFLEIPNIRIRFMRDKLISEVLEALLVIRGLIVQKTKLIGDCNRLLKDLLDSLLLESSENKRQFIRACISGLQTHAKERKGRTSLFILEQLCNVICPSKPEPVYLLNLNKAHTQEEFIRGSMTKNPYSSAEIGSLMRDVKNKICHQLDLLGLLEDDYGMELLVAGNIISLDLSISQVYEQVWKKSYIQSQSAVSNSALLSSVGFTSSSECPPMTVTYRLQGLDGEATEPMIKELEEDREESQDPEVEFAIAGAVRECGGLEIILSMLQCLRDDELKSNEDEVGSVLNLLMYCCKIRENRRALLQLGALGLLLETAWRAFSVDAVEPAEGILLIVESLTMEANESDIGIAQSVLTVNNEETGAGDQAKKIVVMFLERLCHPSGMKKSNKQRNNEMVARILPYLTYGEPAAMEALIQHFDPYLRDWGEFDRLQKMHLENPNDENLIQRAGKQRSSVENFVRVSESLKTSSCGERLKDIILEKGITEVAVKHLRESLAVAGQTGFRSSKEWIHGLQLPSVPLILSMLRGISRGHLASQKCIDEGGILPLLHVLEGVPGENEIGARAENLLDTLSDKERIGDGFLGEKVHKLRHATKDEMRRRALRNREELLQGLGMRQELASDGGERIIVSRPIIEGLDDVEEEEDGFACMVCREGYTLRPNDVLGVYSYTKRVNLGGGSSGGSARSDCVYTTVSHFNIIHFQCHQEAKRADAALKNPKKEWEGATLRNNETLCNSIFPLRGPSVPLAQYARYVEQFWENLNALGRADGSRLRLLTYDIVLMLARFATGASFSTDSRGGGRESNSRFFPFMIQMASYLIDQGSANQPRRAMAKAVSAYLASSSSTSESPTRTSSPSGFRTSSGGTDETVQFMMVNSLLSESYEDWCQHRLAFLQRGIFHACMQHAHGRSTLRLSSDPGAGIVPSDVGSSDPDSRSRLFSVILPMLVYVGMIEQLQRFFKVNKAAGAGTSKQPQGEDGGGGAALEKWELVMRDRLVNMKEMVDFSREMLSWLEDMTSSADLQEAFDVMGVLPDVLSGGYSSCDDFVQAAIAAGKR